MTTASIPTCSQWLFSVDAHFKIPNASGLITSPSRKHTKRKETGRFKKHSSKPRALAKRAKQLHWGPKKPKPNTQVCAKTFRNDGKYQILTRT